jgi:hypothetical protein
MSTKFEQQRLEKALKELLKLPNNKRCVNCDGMVRVCTVAQRSGCDPRKASGWNPGDIAVLYAAGAPVRLTQL